MAAALAAALAALTVALGAVVAGQSRPDRFDAPVDKWLSSGFGAHEGPLSALTSLGDVSLVIAMTAVLVVACAAVRRWRGAVLAATGMIAAAALTEVVLKPLVGRTLGGGLSYPSGHATSSFALATMCAILFTHAPSPRVPAIVRRLLLLGAFLLAAAVSFAMVALNNHYFTDIVGGAAIGTAAPLLTALLIDLVCGSAAWRARLRPARPRSPGS
jgi:membrane-associated phospholipid phosphatase